MAQIFQRGLDASVYQGTINWQSVKGAGVQFAVLRAVSSSNSGPVQDTTFQTNYTNASAQGLRVGAYYYTYARDTAYADRELAAVQSALQGKKLAYPVFIDVEDSSLTSLGRAQLTQLVLYAIKKLRAAGFYAGFYTYAYFAQTYLDMEQLAGYPFWLADYENPVVYNGRYDMLQYTDKGKVPGIATNVCRDVAYTNFLPAIQAGGYNGYTAASPVKMIPLTNMALKVFGTLNCQYFNSPDVYDIAGTLAVGEYTALAQSEGCYNGFSWVTVAVNGKTYWTALLGDRCILLQKA